MGRTNHIAILREPYLKRILAAEKTIESRFLRRRSAPYGRVVPGDRIWLKRVAGPIVAHAHAIDVRQYDNLTPDSVTELVERFADELRLDSAFLATASDCRYAVLIWLGEIHVLPAPFRYEKRDRRGWIILDSDPRL